MKTIAEKLLSYYTKTESRYGGDWKANIDAAKTWFSLLAEDDPSEAEIEELLTKLHSAAIHRGTAWEEMVVYVQRWVSAARQKRPTTNAGKNHVPQGNR
jgi:hypothetical protein